MAMVCASLPAYAFEEKDFVLVKGGCFMMGERSIDGSDKVVPSYEVCLDDFHIGKHEVTQQQWKDVMGEYPGPENICKKCPVDNATGETVVEFISKLNGMTGQDHALPTEAQWEYAARGGQKGDFWAGTSNRKKIGKYAWYGSNSKQRAHKVGEKKPNPVGLYDMSGNVWELVSDWYSKDPSQGDMEGSKLNPKGPPTGDTHVKKGGGYRSGSMNLLVWRRAEATRACPSGCTGFRLVKTP